MFFVDQIGLPQLGLRGLEADMSEEERAIQDSAHRFAEEVMRPIAEKLDKTAMEYLKKLERHDGGGYCGRVDSFSAAAF